MTIETKELASMRDSFALASDDGQRINSSDSRTIVVVLSEAQHTELLNILEHDHAGKEKHLDELCENMMLQGITARIRSIEYSERTKKNAELAKLVAECKNPEELASLLTKLKARP
jgi:urocanate hydratase